MTSGGRLSHLSSMSIATKACRSGASSGVVRAAYSEKRSLWYRRNPCLAASRRATVDLPLPLPPPMNRTCRSPLRSTSKLSPKQENPAKRRGSGRAFRHLGLLEIHLGARRVVLVVRRALLAMAVVLLATGCGGYGGKSKSSSTESSGGGGKTTVAGVPANNHGTKSVSS